MKEDENIEFIEDKSQDFINHLIRNDTEVNGSVKIDVRSDGKYDITLYKGSEKEVNKINKVSKEKLIELLETRI